MIDDKCEIKQIVELDGIKNRDWEDIAVGPGPDSTKSYVYIGDIGDNDGAHQFKYIYRFEEPVDDPQDNKQTITDFDKIVFRLPDSRRMDTEALFIDAATKDLYVVTKRENPVYVYQIKYSLFFKRHCHCPGNSVTTHYLKLLPRIFLQTGMI